MSFLQVASWNIEHLGGSSRAQRKQSAFALADHIEMSGIDLIGIQEIYVTPHDEAVVIGSGQPPINSRAQSERRNSDLDIVCYLLEEHLDVSWAYIILPNRNEGDKSQLCAAMWDTGRLKLENVLDLGVKHKDAAGNALWDRKPHLLDFTGKVDAWRRDADGHWHKEAEHRRFSFVPLHMKSNYGGVTKNRIVRAAEAAELCRALDEKKGDYDPSLMMMGDTNILNNSEPAVENFIAAGYVDLNNNDSSTYWSSQFSDAPFDRCFIAPGRPEFRYSRQYVLRSADLQAHDRLLSDHYMIKVSVKDYVDDIDPRPRPDVTP